MINVSLISTKGSDHNLLLVKALPSFPVRTHHYLLAEQGFQAEERGCCCSFSEQALHLAECITGLSQYLCEVPLFLPLDLSLHLLGT